MKYGIVISVSKTRFGPVVFKEDLEDNIVKASQFGYDGVELAIRKPEELDIHGVEKLIERHGLEIISIGTGQIYGEEGLNFSDTDSDIRNRAVEWAKKIIDIAGFFDASIIIGLVRGNVGKPEASEDRISQAEENISSCLGRLMSYKNASNIDFLIEPINRYEVDIFNRIDEVCEFLDKHSNRLDQERIGILADTFHMNIEEPVMEKSINNYHKRIKHVHFADSNRWPPGSGHIDFNNIMQVLKNNNYEGYISFEMLPEPDPDTSAIRAIEYTKRLEDNLK